MVVRNARIHYIPYFPARRSSDPRVKEDVGGPLVRVAREPEAELGLGRAKGGAEVRTRGPAHEEDPEVERARHTEPAEGSEHGDGPRHARAEAIPRGHRSRGGDQARPRPEVGDAVDVGRSFALR